MSDGRCFFVLKRWLGLAGLRVIYFHNIITPSSFILLKATQLSQDFLLDRRHNLESSLPHVFH